MSPSKLLIRKRSRAARKGEAYIAEYRFPAHIERRVRRRFPRIDEAGWRLVEQGLREWFVCCAWRGRTILGMPSRLVDEAWHEFILDSVAYTQFCTSAVGSYLHHTPDEAMSTPSGDLLGETVRAWDRSDAGSENDSILWDLDERVGIFRRWLWRWLRGRQLSPVLRVGEVEAAAGVPGGALVAVGGDAAGVLEDPRQVQHVPGGEGGVAVGEVVLGAA